MRTSRITSPLSSDISATGEKGQNGGLFSGLGIFSSNLDSAVGSLDSKLPNLNQDADEDGVFGEERSQLELLHALMDEGDGMENANLGMIPIQALPPHLRPRIAAHLQSQGMGELEGQASSLISRDTPQDAQHGPFMGQNMVGEQNAETHPKTPQRIPTQTPAFAQAMPQDGEPASDGRLHFDQTQQEAEFGAQKQPNPKTTSPSALLKSNALGDGHAVAKSSTWMTQSAANPLEALPQDSLKGPVSLSTDWAVEDVRQVQGLQAIRNGGPSPIGEARQSTQTGDDGAQNFADNASIRLGQKRSDTIDQAFSKLFTPKQKAPPLNYGAVLHKITRNAAPQSAQTSIKTPPVTELSPLQSIPQTQGQVLTQSGIVTTPKSNVQDAPRTPKGKRQMGNDLAKHPTTLKASGPRISPQVAPQSTSSEPQISTPKEERHASKKSEGNTSTQDSPITRRKPLTLGQKRVLFNQFADLNQPGGQPVEDASASQADLSNAIADRAALHRLNHSIRTQALNLANRGSELIHTAAIEVNDKRLGKLRINLELSGNRLHIEVPNATPEVQAMLDSNHADLQQQLAKHDLSLESFTSNGDGSTGQNPNGQKQGQHQGQNGPLYGGDNPDLANEETTDGNRHHDGLINTVI